MKILEHVSLLQMNNFTIYSDVLAMEAKFGGGAENSANCASYPYRQCQSDVADVY